MITPEENKDKEKQKKTVYKETDQNEENLDNGETSSASDLDRSAFSKKPARENKPLGSSHEPGVTPGRDF